MCTRTTFIALMHRRIIGQFCHFLSMSCRVEYKRRFLPGQNGIRYDHRETVVDFLGGKKPFAEGKKMKLILSLILLLPALSWAGWPVSGNKSAVQRQAQFLAKN